MNGQLKHFGFKLGMKIISTISTSRIETQCGVTDGDERKLGASFSLGFNWNLFVTNELKSKTFVQFFLDLSYTQFEFLFNGVDERWKKLFKDFQKKLRYLYFVTCN
jgi:hypothetical protein